VSALSVIQYWNRERLQYPGDTLVSEWSVILNYRKVQLFWRHSGKRRECNFELEKDSKISGDTLVSAV
jgi:hypothetical protein